MTAPFDAPNWLGASDCGSDRLARARALWRGGERLLVDRDPLARDLGSRLLAWLVGDADGPLEDALGISGGGRSSLRQEMRRENRDVALRTLARASRFEGLDAATAARLLVQAWLRYETTSWPRHKRSGEAPAAEPEATFFALLAAGHKMLSHDHLARILRGQKAAHGDFDPVDSPADLCHDDPGKETPK